MLSGRGLCDGLITSPEESYRLWRVVVCDQETSKTRRLKARYRAVENTTTMGCNAKQHHLIYTTRLHRMLVFLKYGGSYLNKTLFVHVGISVKQVLLLIIVCNLMFLSEYVIY